MNIPRDLRYAKTHEWVRLESDAEAVIGITDFAQAQLGDLTYIELPSVDDAVAAQDEVGVVESVKAASDLYAPISGTVVAVNEGLTDHPELINGDPYNDGWLFKLKPGNPAELDELFDADAYEELVPEEE